MYKAELIPPIIGACLPIRLVAQICEVMEARRLRTSELCEIRLRLEQPASLTTASLNIIIDAKLTRGEMSDCLTKLCGGSVYSHDESMREGFIRVDGGIRVGVCGTFSGSGRGPREITSLNIRLPHIIRGVGAQALKYCLADGKISSALFYSPPGVGKTTLLRDIAYELSTKYQKRIVLIDTRGELYISEMFRQSLCDVLTGYPKALGIEIATRVMSPEAIICDELGGADEAKQILSAQNTGVPLIASAHASNVEELLRRPNISLLDENRVFACYVGIARERIGEKLSRQFTYTYTDCTKTREHESCHV